MNKTRRKWLVDIIDQLTEAKGELENISEEEHEAYDNLPESIQFSERGETITENADDIDTAISDLEDIIDSLQEITER